MLLALNLAAADPWAAVAEAAALPPAQQKEALEKLLTERPDFLPAHFNLGTLLLRQEPPETETAVRHLEQAATSPVVEQAADAWHNLALARWKQGRLEDAVTAATQAARLRPEFAPLRDELRRAALARLDEARRKAEEEAKKLKLPDARLPVASVGEPYEAQVVATGGTAPRRFTTAKPPPGLTLDADGRLHGVPPKAGEEVFEATVADAAQGTATGKLTLRILPPPAIRPESLAEAIAGQPYRADLEAEGVVDPTWRAEGLPQGLAIAPGPGGRSAITGTPTATGTAQVTVTADDGRRRAQRRYELVVGDGFAPDRDVLPPATAWSPYRHRLGVRGAPQEYRWEAPTTGGIAVGSDGAVAGTPDKAGDLAIAATITAADGRQRRAPLTLPVNPPPVIDEDSAIQLTQGVAADRALKRTGGTEPFAWRIGDGALPKGLRLDADGRLRGAPAEPGESVVTVELKDRWGATTRKELKLSVTKHEQQPPDQKDQKDQKQQDPKDQQQDPKDQQQAGKDQQGKDQQGKDQQGKDQQPGSDGKDQQPQQPQGGKDPQQAQAGEAGKDPQKQAESIGAAAAERWLDQLEGQDHDAMRLQLLPAGRPPQRGKPW